MMCIYKKGRNKIFREHTKKSLTETYGIKTYEIKPSLMSHFHLSSYRDFCSGTSLNINNLCCTTLILRSITYWQSVKIMQIISCLKVNVFGISKILNSSSMTMCVNGFLLLSDERVLPVSITRFSGEYLLANPIR